MSQYIEEIYYIDNTNCDYFTGFKRPPVYGGGRRDVMVGFGYTTSSYTIDEDGNVSRTEEKKIDTTLPIEMAYSLITFNPLHPRETAHRMYGVDYKDDPWPTFDQ